MLLDFSLGNFRSFNGIQTLNFRATGLVSELKEVDQRNIAEIGGQRVLKTIGVYGPNGSGKTNLIAGLRLFRSLVQYSLESEVVMDFAADPFRLSTIDQGQEGYFQIQLLIEGRKYRYGFTLDGGSVQEEWLFGPAEKNDTWYFTRDDEGVQSNKEWFAEGHSMPIENLRANTLFLTFASAYNGQISQAIKGFIVNNIAFEDFDLNRRSVNVRFGRPRPFGASRKHSTNNLLREGKASLVLDWLKSVGLNYADIFLDQNGESSERVLVDKHVLDKDGTPSLTVQMDFDLDESAGTRKFYYYIGVMVYFFENGGLLISDEIDNNFHPSLLRQFIRFFNDPAINTGGAQLLFTSHDTNLLDPELLRRDQIYFAEKSIADETILYALSDLKGIRNNADFARQYLAGFYGALPLLETYKESPPDPDK